MTAFQKLDQLTILAKADPRLRQALLATAQSDDAIWDFCELAQAAGVELYAGELLPSAKNIAITNAKAPTAATPPPIILLTMPTKTSSNP